MGIGMALRTIADRLIEMAAEASEPVIGWAIGAARAYSNIQKVISEIRIINAIFKGIASAIQAFVAAKTAIFDKASIVENLVQGAAGSAAA